ncbi:MAG: hypothetical protein AB1768_04005 [Pseudomonadota bacterium]
MVRSGGAQRPALQLRHSDIARQATRHNFLTAQNMGVRAFPSLLLHRDAAFWWVCRGYAEAGPLLRAIERGLAE